MPRGPGRPSRSASEMGRKWAGASQILVPCGFSELDRTSNPGASKPKSRAGQGTRLGDGCVRTTIRRPHARRSLKSSSSSTRPVSHASEAGTRHARSRSELVTRPRSDPSKANGPSGTVRRGLIVNLPLKAAALARTVGPRHGSAIGADPNHRQCDADDQKGPEKDDGQSAMAGLLRSKVRDAAEHRTRRGLPALVKALAFRRASHR